jgi:hypothetical protein
LRASTAFRTVFVEARFRAGFAVFALFPVFALVAVFFAAFDVLTVFELPRAVCFGFAGLAACASAAFSDSLSPDVSARSAAPLLFEASRGK